MSVMFLKLINMPEEVKTEPVIDLDKLRDDKCLPVAQGMLEDMVENLLPTEDTGSNYNLLVKQMLTRTLEADLNVAMEVSYVPQLILGALSGLSTTVQSCSSIVAIDDARYAAIGKKLLSMVAGAKVRMNKVKQEDTLADFAGVKEEMEALFASEKLNMMEVKYIMDNIFDSFKIADGVFKNSLDGSVARAEAKAFGVESMNDLTMKGLDGFLTSDFTGLKA